MSMSLCANHRHHPDRRGIRAAPAHPKHNHVHMASLDLAFGELMFEIVPYTVFFVLRAILLLFFCCSQVQQLHVRMGGGLLQNVEFRL